MQRVQSPSSEEQLGVDLASQSNRVTIQDDQQRTDATKVSKREERIGKGNASGYIHRGSKWSSSWQVRGGKAVQRPWALIRCNGDDNQKYFGGTNAEAVGAVA